MLTLRRLTTSYKIFVFPCSIPLKPEEMQEVYSKSLEEEELEAMPNKPRSRPAIYEPFVFALKESDHLGTIRLTAS